MRASSFSFKNTVEATMYRKSNGFLRTHFMRDDSFPYRNLCGVVVCLGTWRALSCSICLGTQGYQFRILPFKFCVPEVVLWLARVVPKHLGAVLAALESSQMEVSVLGWNSLTPAGWGRGCFLPVWC
jgi:hypothetical protein